MCFSLSLFLILSCKFLFRCFTFLGILFCLFSLFCCLTSFFRSFFEKRE